MFGKDKGPSLGGLTAYSKNRKKSHGAPSAPHGGMVHGKPDGDMPGEPDADDTCPHCGGPMGGGMGGGPPMPPPMKGMR